LLDCTSKPSTWSLNLLNILGRLIAAGHSIYIGTSRATDVGLAQIDELGHSIYELTYLVQSATGAAIFDVALVMESKGLALHQETQIRLFNTTLRAYSAVLS